MTEPAPEVGSALELVRARLDERDPAVLADGMLTVVLGGEQHTLALTLAANGFGAACSCLQWDALQFGRSRTILERIAESWREHLHRSDPSSG